MIVRGIRLSLIVLMVWHSGLFAQGIYSDNLAHTFSIVARDPGTGEMGVAVQTHWFAVGADVSWAEAGVGAIATQAFVNPSFGPRGLALLKQGLTAEEVLKQLLESDQGRQLRQIGIIDGKGNTASWTGERNIAEAGHMAGKNFSVQANMMLTDRVWSAMAAAFERAHGHLSVRMLAALEAGQAAGGDIRGRQSAAMIVVRGQGTGNAWEGRKIDLRVDDHKEPLKELERLLQLSAAYQHLADAEQALGKNDVDAALMEFDKAQKLAPDNLEMKYWRAVSLANVGRVEASLPYFKSVFSRDANWWILTRRLPQAGILQVDEQGLQKILSQK